MKYILLKCYAIKGNKLKKFLNFEPMFFYTYVSQEIILLKAVYYYVIIYPYKIYTFEFTPILKKAYIKDMSTINI